MPALSRPVGCPPHQTWSWLSTVQVPLVAGAVDGLEGVVPVLGVQTYPGGHAVEDVVPVVVGKDGDEGMVPPAGVPALGKLPEAGMVLAEPGIVGDVPTVPVLLAPFGVQVYPAGQIGVVFVLFTGVAVGIVVFCVPPDLAGILPLGSVRQPATKSKNRAKIGKLDQVRGISISL